MSRLLLCFAKFSPRRYSLHGNCSDVFCSLLNNIVIYEPSAGRRCSRMSAFFKARATKERVPLIKARMNGRCLHASGSYNIFCTKIKLNFFVLIH
jgi:hypothetical protein